MSLSDRDQRIGPPPAGSSREPPAESPRTAGLLLGAAILVVAAVMGVLGAFTGIGGGAIGAAITLFGLAAFMAGAVWLGWTVLKQTPLETWPYGIGLVAVSLAGLMVIVAGAAYPEGSPAEDTPKSQEANGTAPDAAGEKPASQPELVDTLRDEVADLRLKLGERERRVAELEGLLADRPSTVQGAEAPIRLTGSIVARSTRASLDAVDFVVFEVGNVTPSSAVDLSPLSTIVTYVDRNQLVPLPHTDDVTTSPGWHAKRSTGPAGTLEPGEQAEFTVNLTGLVSPLAEDTEFMIEVMPGGESTSLIVEAEVPSVLTGSMVLE